MVWVREAAAGGWEERRTVLGWGGVGEVGATAVVVEGGGGWGAVLCGTGARGCRQGRCLVTSSGGFLCAVGHAAHANTQCTTHCSSTYVTVRASRKRVHVHGKEEESPVACPQGLPRHCPTTPAPVPTIPSPQYLAFSLTSSPPPPISHPRARMLEEEEEAAAKCSLLGGGPGSSGSGGPGGGGGGGPGSAAASVNGVRQGREGGEGVRVEGRAWRPGGALKGMILFRCASDPACTRHGRGCQAAGILLVGQGVRSVA